MEIILKEDIVNLGYKNDIVKVKPGYARNYLIPQGFAIAATPSNRKMIEENTRQAAHKLAKVKEDAESLAKELEKLDIVIKAKTGTSGKIFGSITTQQIASAIKEKGHEIDRRKIKISGEVKTLGKYIAEVELYKDVVAEVPFNVTGEKEVIGEKETEKVAKKPKAAKEPEEKSKATEQSKETEEATQEAKSPEEAEESNEEKKETED